MKKFLILAFFTLLIGCNQQIKNYNDDDSTISQKIEQKNNDAPNTVLGEIKQEKIGKTAGLGEMCGGIIGIICEPSLKCKYNGDYPDAGGVCVETVMDKNLECPKTKSPVCGLVEREKNGYLNECEARRHGAEILHKGLCKFDETVKGSCKTKVRAISNCETSFTGYEYDGTKCIQVSIGGCDAEIPFENLQECENACN